MAISVTSEELGFLKQLESESVLVWGGEELEMKTGNCRLGMI